MGGQGRPPAAAPAQALLQLLALELGRLAVKHEHGPDARLQHARRAVEHTLRAEQQRGARCARAARRSGGSQACVPHLQVAGDLSRLACEHLVALPPHLRAWQGRVAGTRAHQLHGVRGWQVLSSA